MYILGIDTSNYVTSLAVLQKDPDQEALLVHEKRITLEVIKGGKGLRQSEAVFQHIKNMPEIWEDIFATLQGDSIRCVAASVKPRPLEGSYMPVFQVGESYGRCLASFLQVPFFGFSHQEGHIETGYWNSKCRSNHFLSLHLSGGTTELVEAVRNPQRGMDIHLLGGTNDLNAGQFIDRVGVKLGLSFPAGRELEKLAAGNNQGGLKVPVSVKGYDISFSGPATFVERALEGGAPAAEAARGVEVSIAHSLIEVLRKAADDKSLQEVLVVGGVASNAFIRRRLMEGLPSLSFYFPSPRFAGDSAVGPALLAAQLLSTA